MVSSISTVTSTMKKIRRIFLPRDRGGLISPLGTPNSFLTYFLLRLTGILFFIFRHYFEIRPATRLMAKATINVLKAKESSPCIHVNLLILLELICTSETWKVIPTTKEK